MKAPDKFLHYASQNPGAFLFAESKIPNGARRLLQAISTVKDHGMLIAYKNHEKPSYESSYF